MASHRARRPRVGGVADGVRQHAAARVRVAPAQRRHVAGVRHLRRRRGSEARRRDHRRERRRHERRQHPQRARARAPAWPPAPPTSAAPSGATTARRSIFAGRASAAAGSISGCWTSARGTCRQLTTDGGRWRARVQRAQLRSGVRARRQRRVRVDARRDADAGEVPAQLQPLSRRSRPRLLQPGADDVPAQRGDRARLHAGRPRQHDDREGRFEPERADAPSISWPAAASIGT